MLIAKPHAGLLAVLCLFGFITQSLASDVQRLYVGTYTGTGPQESRGIYVVDFDSTTGQLSNARLAAESTNPSFLTVDETNRRLFSVSEVRTENGRSGAALVSWRIADDGQLVELGRAPTSGDGPCYVAFHSGSGRAGVANYGGGSVALFQIDGAGIPTQTAFVKHVGSSVNSQRQGEPHAHSFLFTANGEQAFAADLGTDELIAYSVGSEGNLQRNDALTTKMTPGHGPRHFAFSPDERFVAVIQELSSQVSIFKWNDADLTLITEASTLPADFTGNNTTAEVLFHPNGRFLYGSNRGHDSIAVFSFDPETGQIKLLANVSSGGETPRNFRLSPDGRWLLTANQSSNNLVAFAVGDDGIPKATEYEVKISKPVCIKFLGSAE